MNRFFQQRRRTPVTAPAAVREKNRVLQSATNKRLDERAAPLFQTLMEANQVRKFLLLIMSAAALALFSLGAHAQEADGGDAGESVGVEIDSTVSDTMGEIKGTVKDVSQGGVEIKEASIKYKGPDGITDEVFSDAEGKFEIKNLQPGNYILDITKDGYRDRKNVLRTVQAGTPVVLEVKMREKTTLFVFAKRFGWVGIPLLLCSIAAVTFIIERIFTYAKLNSGTETLLARVDEALSHDDVTEARQACEEAGTPIANVLKSGLTRYSAGLLRK